MSKTALSFYLDDTSCYHVPPSAFRTLLDVCRAEGIRGESTILLGHEWETHGLLSRPTTASQREYINLLQLAPQCGLEANMELLTHKGLFDFACQRVPEGAVHEGLWLYEPDISLDEYESYFDNIISEGDRIGVQFAGVTWPGCDCPACEARFRELRRDGQLSVNPKVWEALLRGAGRGRFASDTVTCFTFSSSKEHPAVKASSNGYRVWDLMPNAGDRLGSYTNSSDMADADYYINAEGTRGRLVELVQAGAPHGIFYAHWQGMNPYDGVGWQAFLQVIRRVQQHLRDQVEWLTPSEYASRLKLL
jgi:hypothetical protein